MYGNRGSALRVSWDSEGAWACSGVECSPGDEIQEVRDHVHPYGTLCRCQRERQSGVAAGSVSDTEWRLGTACHLGLGERLGMHGRRVQSWRRDGRRERPRASVRDVVQVPA